MSLPIWPSDLVTHHPTRDSWQYSPVSVTRRTDFDQGAARVRQRYSSGVKRVQENFRFTAFELEVFKAFFESTLHGGASWFLMPFWYGEGYFESECRFVDPYAIGALAPDFYQVSISIEIRRTFALSEAVIWFLQNYDEAFLFSFADRLQPTINDDLALPGYPYVTRDQ
jgi:hypothetical protein